ncbi:MAG: glutamate--cysteine ligase, partial [Alphaproteobacteria bacterium]
MADANSPLISGKADLIRWLEEGQSPKSEWRIGTEHEKFLFHLDTFKRPAYEGKSGIEALLTGLCQRLEGTP